MVLCRCLASWTRVVMLLHLLPGAGRLQRTRLILRDELRYDSGQYEGQRVNV